MSTTAIQPAILDTVLGHLALIFLAATGGDLKAARDAANQMLAAYHPQTPAELNLAAAIISFSAQALEALGQSAAPDLPLTRVLRLRGSAVSLSREAHKAQRKLDQLQKARRTVAEVQPAQSMPVQALDPEPTPPPPQTDDTVAPVEATRPAVAQAKTWTQRYQQRQAARRISENLKKNHAAHQATLKVAPVGISASIAATL